MLGLSPLELAVIALIIVVLFGAKRLPELGSGLGKAISNFKKGYSEATALDVTPKDGKSHSDQKGGDHDKGANKDSDTGSDTGKKPQSP